MKRISGRKLINGQNGFTLIEMIVVIAISSLILLGTVVSIHQIFFSGNNIREEMESIQYVQNAGGWLRIDTLKSQIIVPGDNPGTGENETLTLYWSASARKDAQDNDCLDYYEVSYILNNAKLIRKEYITTNVYEPDGDFVETTINENIALVSGNVTNVSVISDNVSLIVSITSTVDDAETTKTYEVFPRSIN